MATQVKRENELKETYDKIVHHFGLFSQKLGITTPKSHYSLACIMLIRAVYYQANLLKIDWPLIRKHWHSLSEETPMLTDADFADLQYQCLMMRSLGEEYELRSRRRTGSKPPKKMIFKHLLIIYPIVFPLAVISVYPHIRKFKLGDGEDDYNWSMLHTYGIKAKISILRLCTCFCKPALLGPATCPCDLPVDTSN